MNDATPHLPVVMIVDDSPVQTNIFRRLTHDIAADFVIVDSWQQAIEALVHQRVDMLITDYNLDDEKTGVDLVKHIQTSGQNPRCFFMTTESPVAIRNELGAFQYSGFLIKPVNFKKFKLFMEKQLGLIEHPLAQRY